MTLRALLARLLSPLRRECRAARLVNPDWCGWCTSARGRVLLYDIPVCASCGAELE